MHLIRVFISIRFRGRIKRTFTTHARYGNINNTEFRNRTIIAITQRTNSFFTSKCKVDGQIK
jgi:hypothetical protein